MQQNIRKLLEEADAACVSFLQRHSETTPPEKFEHELMPIFDRMAQVARGLIPDSSPLDIGHLELAKREVVNEGKKATAHVLLDPYKKLQLIFTSLCPQHGDECPEQTGTSPRNVTLRELRLIGFDGLFIVRSMHEFLHESLVETMITMNGPTVAC